MLVIVHGFGSAGALGCLGGVSSVNAQKNTALMEAVQGSHQSQLYSSRVWFLVWKVVGIAVYCLNRWIKSTEAWTTRRT